MTGKLKVGVAIALSSLAALTLGASFWANRPFQAQLGTYRTSLADRTDAQRHNIRQAVTALNGVRIEPKAIFSFNETVGPRTPERGYREAPAFMERDLVTSIGGGICQVSSTLYNAALHAGLCIVERHPHSRRVASVPPGRDATVWFARTDLRIRNPYPFPVRLVSQVESEVVLFTFLGRSENQRQVKVQTVVMPPSRAGHVVVKTVRMNTGTGGGSHEVISFDSYPF